MLYWLADFSDQISVLNVFRYITFRTGGAVVTALLFVFFFGSPIIDLLRIRQGKGQPIREDGPESHLVTKMGTPTMGGLMILSGLIVATLLWANPANPYVWIVLAVTLCFGVIGFYDDYLKVTKQIPQGLFRLAAPRARSADRRARLLRDRRSSAPAALDVARLAVLQGAGLRSRLVLHRRSAPSSSSAPAMR